jgi:hypothetical protein
VVRAHGAEANNRRAQGSCHQHRAYQGTRNREQARGGCNTSGHVLQIADARLQGNPHFDVRNRSISTEQFGD